jgi:Kdo2-lipid IVA lauroyltransferase/acyltransferase
MVGRRSPKVLLDAAIGSIAVGALRVVKLTDRKRTANVAGALMRKVGPLCKEHSIGRDNLRAAFPDKSDVEIEKILAGVWDNLGRVAVEFAHLDEFRLPSPGTSHPDGLLVPPELMERGRRILASGKPTIWFTAHLANWELFAVAVKQLGANTAVLYRRPNIEPIANLVTKLRAPVMGQLIPTGLAAPLKLARLLQAGVHVGMLADQHYTRGVPVTFFGRQCLANPLIALLARQTECAIHGARSIRLPDGNSFSGEITEAIEPVRDSQGRIDVNGTMQAITSVIEGWVRKHPEQWLWPHRRWR